ncbi:GNAT family N-acetyltransferase [Streptomyces sp. TRM70308]|uniref:GNAT family N-acetyltransferase n=1 Tax=Streptomyces sp. TRM70308 TaxID=3131932 RepID=UPI003D084B03
MPDVSVRLADAADRPVLERLWLMFHHDLSGLSGALPNPDGTFRTDRLDAAFSGPDWAPYLLRRADRPVGLAFVRNLHASPYVLNSFFVVSGARRTGIGLRAAQQVISRHPGRWEIAFQESNTAAVRFWRRVATTMAGAAWTEEPRAVPGRPELPPDRWIAFTTAAGPSV